MALFGVSTFLASKVFLFLPLSFSRSFAMIIWTRVLNLVVLVGSPSRQVYNFPDQEYFVMEHDFYVGMGLAIVLSYLIKTQGPAYTAE